MRILKIVSVIIFFNLSLVVFAGEMDELLAQVHADWLKNGKQYSAKNMTTEYEAKDKKWGVEYWSETDRRRSELKFKDGQAVVPANLPQSETSSGGIVVRLGSGEVRPTDSLLMYVLTGDGRLYAYPMRAMKVQHSTFLSGQPIAAAGMIQIIDGKIRYIDNSSGHYKPSLYYLAQVIHALHREGVDLEGVKLGLDRGNKFEMARYGSGIHVKSPTRVEECRNIARVVAYFP